MPALFLFTGRFIGFSPRRDDKIHRQGEIWQGGADRTSINHKTINNLPRWGHFQPHFRCPLAVKLLTGPPKICKVKWWHGPPLSSCKTWWKSNEARRRERTKTGPFHFLYRQELPAGQLYRYCFYSRTDFSVFRPAGATRCTDEGEIWQGAAVLPAKCHLDRFQECGFTAPET